MSCTVVAIPFALHYVVGALVATAGIHQSFLAEEEDIQTEDNIDVSMIKNINSEQEICEQDFIITEQNFINKTFETPFMDKNILLKTLEEHGFVNIQELGEKITAEYQNYSVQFEKESNEKPYNLLIEYSTEDDVNEKVKDLNEEYSMNVQEESYLNIIAKLKENNMQIAEEEVLDDNTIVLTVNLEN